jgi:hypothetical protein
VTVILVVVFIHLLDNFPCFIVLTFIYWELDASCVNENKAYKNEQLKFCRHIKYRNFHISVDSSSCVSESSGSISPIIKAIIYPTGEVKPQSGYSVSNNYAGRASSIYFGVMQANGLVENPKIRWPINIVMIYNYIVSNIPNIPIRSVIIEVFLLHIFMSFQPEIAPMIIPKTKIEPKTLSHFFDSNSPSHLNLASSNLSH